jgi:hypothetical protein
MIRPIATLLAALVVAGCATTQTNVAPRPAAAVIPTAPPRGEPGQYVNMPAVALQAAFGRPAFVRKDGATEMWRYDGTACRAFFFLYGAPLAVRHVETLPHARDQAADIGCLNALRAMPPKVS